MTEFVDTRVIYIGTDDNGSHFLTVEELAKCDTATDAYKVSSCFALKKGVCPKIVGGIYVVAAKAAENTKLGTIKSSFKYTRADDVEVDEIWIAVWQAADRAFKVQKRVDKEEADAAKDSKLQRALAGLRTRYMRTDRIGRLALEVVLLDALRNK